MKRPVNIETTFLRSIVACVSMASLVLANAEENMWPTAFTPVVAVFAYIFVDRKKLIRLSLLGANGLGIVAFVAAIIEFREGNLLEKLLAGAHLLVYITWVVLLLKKGIRQFWWLTALSVLQISVASVLTTNASFGAALVLMLLTMLWTLSVFSLYRAQLRLARSSDGVEDSLNVVEDTGSSSGLLVRNGLQVDSDERWIGWRFRAIVGFAFVASLCVAMVAFVAFPRVWVNAGTLPELQSSRNALTHQTGFTDNVELGEIGEIMQSDARVLQFEITRMDGGAVVAPDAFASAMKMDEILFRGNALGHYNDGRWTSGSAQVQGVGDTEHRQYEARPRQADYRVRITQDPPIRKFAFAPVPAINARSRERRGRINQRRFSYSLIHDIHENRSRSEPLVFEVWCVEQPSRRAHGPSRIHRDNSDLQKFIQSLVQPILRTRGERYRPEQHNYAEERTYAESCNITRGLAQSLPLLTRQAVELCTTDDGGVVSVRQRVERIFGHLTTSGTYSYSLTADIIDQELDPVEDFLLNRKVGHCEYFASTCALMLQAVGVPARVVNGYKGSEVNTVSGRSEVKQKHAHTWVEVYVDFAWETLDPTPAAARREGVTQARTFDWWSDLRLAFSDNWFDMIQKMSPQRQEAMIRPWLNSGRNALATIREQGLWAALKIFYQEVVLQPGKWFSAQTGVVTFAILLIVGLVIRQNPGSWMLSPFHRFIDWMRPDRRQQRSVVRFYENFRNLCSRHGLLLPDHCTAQENADAAAAFFDGQLVSVDDKVLPRRIAAVFNRVRFGAENLTPEVVISVRGDVVRFSELLAARQTSESAIAAAVPDEPEVQPATV
jgi:protein-glutamine gamma-glutamyltransferase